LERFEHRFATAASKTSRKGTVPRKLTGK
jgi:hypothetical protein